MASLDILCSNTLNLKNKIRPIKNFEKYFMTHWYTPNIFHDPHKNPPVPLPTYVMYGP